jgi:heme a synthase
MVKSGLEAQPAEFGEPRVSPYRLAAHLASAFAIYAGLLHCAIAARPSFTQHTVPARFRVAAIAVTHLALATAFSGAFVRVWLFFAKSANPTSLRY